MHQPCKPCIRAPNARQRVSVLAVDWEIGSLVVELDAESKRDVVPRIRGALGPVEVSGISISNERSWDYESSTDYFKDGAPLSPAT
jgi:hypothetical protein